MRFHADTAYNELHPHFQERIHRNEPLARHCTFGVGGPADVWVSLETREELVDLADLTGKTHGKAQIAESNANYIVNIGGASASDIAALMEEVHQRVFEECSVDLEVDSELHGEWEE